MKILVTGSSGMIGTALCENLIENNIIKGLDKKKNIWNKEVDKRTNYSDLTWCPIDIEKIEMIIHLAANARVYELVENPRLALENIEMVYSIYEYARNYGIKKIIIASSREVYGDILKTETDGIKEEEANHIKCANQYSASKLFGEAYAKAFKETHNIDTVIARFSNVYGRYDMSDRFIPLVIRKILNNEELDIYGGKEKAMDFTFIDDTIQGIKVLIDNFDKTKNKIYNISSGTITSLFDITEKLQYLMNKKIKVNLKENREGEPMFYKGDIEKIKKLGYKPKHTINQGLEKSIEYYLKFF